MLKMIVSTNGQNAEAILEKAGFEKMPGDCGFVRYFNKGKVRIHAILISDFSIALHKDIRRKSQIGEPKHSSIQDDSQVRKAAILILKHC